MKSSTEQDANRLQEKILALIGRLEGEVDKMREAQTQQLENLTLRCRQDIRKLQMEFSNEIESVQSKHQDKLSALTEEIAYLKEMSNSQRMMMETNLEYIRELELRHSKL